MSKKRRTTVILPNPVPSVELPNHLATPLKHLLQAGPRGANTFELQAKGITSPSKAVSRLIDCGAIIDSKSGPAIGPEGTTHNKIATYIYRSWRIPVGVESDPQPINEEGGSC